MSNPPVPASDYVPSTAQVRRSYDGQWDTSSPHGPEAAAEFDRWLLEHDRRVSETAWDECLKAIDIHELNTEQALAGNPHRTHDEQCEAEYIFPPGGWLPCGCGERRRGSSKASIK